jgi:hypothetical protein
MRSRATLGDSQKSVAAANVELVLIWYSHGTTAVCILNRLIGPGLKLRHKF